MCLHTVFLIQYIINIWHTYNVSCDHKSCLNALILHLRSGSSIPKGVKKARNNPEDIVIHGAYCMSCSVVYLCCVRRKKDLFQSPKAGYYIHCIPSSHGWQHATEPLPLPDARFGFPWTVKDWDKLQKKRSAKAGWGGEVNVNSTSMVSHWSFFNPGMVRRPRTSYTKLLCGDFHGSLLSGSSGLRDTTFLPQEARGYKTLLQLFRFDSREMSDVFTCMR